MIGVRWQGREPLVYLHVYTQNTSVQSTVYSTDYTQGGGEEPPTRSAANC